MEWADLKIGIEDRAILIGATGCGKTTLARYLVEDRLQPYSVVYDPKASRNISGWTSHKIYSNYDELTYADENRLIYRPSIEASLDPYDQERFFMWVYDCMNRRLLIDEAYSVLGGTNPSFHLQAIMSRGRERGISVVVCTQRPRRIPLLLTTEVEHVYVFRLNRRVDRDVVYEMTDLHPNDQLALKNYEFFYYNCLTNETSNIQKLNLRKSNVLPFNQGAVSRRAA